MGVVVSGRAMAHEGLQDVIGPMFNTVPCSINNLSMNATIADLIRACQKFNTDVIPYQHTPLRKIAQYMGQDINNGLFDILFVFQKIPRTKNDGNLWEEIPTTSSPDYPLNIEVEQRGTRFSITFVAKSAHLRAEDARRLFGDYLDIIPETGRNGVDSA